MLLGSVFPNVLAEVSAPARNANVAALAAQYIRVYQVESSCHEINSVIRFCGAAEKTGRVPVTRVAKALFALQHAGLEGRMRITFELFDSDRSGRIDEQELYEILKVRLFSIRAQVDITSYCAYLDMRRCR